MTLQATIESLIAKIRTSVAERLRRNPDEIRYKALLAELERVEQQVRRSWPLDPGFSQSTRFGLFAVRELEDEPDLVEDLVALDKALKHS